MCVCVEDVCEGVWGGVRDGACISTSSFTSCVKSLMMPESGGTMAWLHKCTDDLQIPAVTHSTTPTSAAHTGPTQLT